MWVGLVMEKRIVGNKAAKELRSQGVGCEVTEDDSNCSKREKAQ